MVANQRVVMQSLKDEDNQQTILVVEINAWFPMSVPHQTLIKMVFLFVVPRYQPKSTFH